MFVIYDKIYRFFGKKVKSGFGVESGTVLFQILIRPGQQKIADLKPQLGESRIRI
jgi:hypothetical protein